MSGKSAKDFARFGSMILLGPITFLGAIRGDHEDTGDQFVAGMVGTFLWFMALAELVQAGVMPW